MSLSVPFRNYRTLLNSKFHSIWSIGSIFMAKIAHLPCLLLPAPTNAQQAHYVKNIRGWTFVRASFKCRLFVKVNFSMAFLGCFVLLFLSRLGKQLKAFLDDPLTKSPGLRTPWSPSTRLSLSLPASIVYLRIPLLLGVFPSRFLSVPWRNLSRGSQKAWTQLISHSPKSPGLRTPRSPYTGPSIPGEPALPPPLGGFIFHGRDQRRFHNLLRGACNDLKCQPLTQLAYHNRATTFVYKSQGCWWAALIYSFDFSLNTVCDSIF